MNKINWLCGIWLCLSAIALCQEKKQGGTDAAMQALERLGKKGDNSKGRGYTPTEKKANGDLKNNSNKLTKKLGKPSVTAIVDSQTEEIINLEFTRLNDKIANLCNQGQSRATMSSIIDFFKDTNVYVEVRGEANRSKVTRSNLPQYIEHLAKLKEEQGYDSVLVKFGDIKIAKSVFKDSVYEGKAIFEVSFSSAKLDKVVKNSITKKTVGFMVIRSKPDLFHRRRGKLHVKLDNINVVRERYR